MTPEGRPPSTGRNSPPGSPAPADDSAAGAVDPSPAGSAELVDRICAEIESSPDRRITFARYMERALYEPDLGYYRAAADRPTDAGDFLTAPETHAIFGWTLARRIESMWAELGRPRPFHLIEYGAGSGTLALSILDGLRRHGSAELLDAVRYEPVESNPHRLADLRERFERAGLRRTALRRPALQRCGPRPSRRHPCQRVPRRHARPPRRRPGREAAGALRHVEPGEWRRQHPGRSHAGGRSPGPERLGPWPLRRSCGRAIDPGARRALRGRCRRAGGGPGRRDRPRPRPVARRSGRPPGPRLRPGRSTTATRPPSCTARTASPARCSGTAAITSETDLFAAPGRSDLTAHVDFTAVQYLAAARGFRTVSLTTQSEFLVAAGLEEELRASRPRRTWPSPTTPGPAPASSACSTRATWAVSASCSSPAAVPAALDRPPPVLPGRGSEPHSSGGAGEPR